MPITVTESVRLVLGILEITPTGAVTDSVSVTDVVSIFPADLLVIVTDTVTTDDTTPITLSVEEAIFPPALFRRAKTLKRL